MFAKKPTGTGWRDKLKSKFKDKVVHKVTKSGSTDLAAYKTSSVGPSTSSIGASEAEVATIELTNASSSTKNSAVDISKVGALGVEDTQMVQEVAHPSSSASAITTPSPDTFSPDTPPPDTSPANTSLPNTLPPQPPSTTPIPTSPTTNIISPTPPQSSPSDQLNPAPISPQPPTPTPSTPTSIKSTQPPDLWSRALLKLPTPKQHLLQTLSPTHSPSEPHSSSITSLLNLSKTLKENLETKPQTYLFGGKRIIVKDVAVKIMFWLDKFKQVGDIVANVDPIHVGLPWAGVRFLLQIAVASHEQRGDLVLAIEKLACLIHRGAIYERLWPPGTIPADVLSGLQEHLVKLYTTMLELLTLCHHVFAKSSPGRALHAVINSDEVSKLLSKCDELELQVKHEADVCENKRSQEADQKITDLLGVLREPILRTDERVLCLLKQVDDKERMQILDWISKVVYGYHHKTVKEQRTADTCDWLLNHSSFQEWQDSSASIILWLCGTAGTGKTFLTSKVIDKVQDELKSGPNQEGFAFFYCNRNEAERREPRSVLRAFVRQLSTIANKEDSIQKDLKQFYHDTRAKASEPTISDCKQLLLQLINTYPRTTLILDALDECEKQNRLELIEVLDYLLSEAKKPLKIFISSRPDGDIKEKLKDRDNIEIRATDNQDDISRFVKSRLKKHRKWGTKTMDASLQKKIIETLQERSQGMFQWAFLQIEQLLKLQLRSEIEDRLGKLPKGLVKAYDEIYDGMTVNEKVIANRAFQWVMCARKPVGSEVLLPAIVQNEAYDTLQLLDDLDEDLVLEYCHNLLVIDPVRHVWVPSHLSVIEYFENNLWKQSEANSLVGGVCLLVLNNVVFYNREERWVISEDDDSSSDDASSKNSNSQNDDSSEGDTSSDGDSSSSEEAVYEQDPLDAKTFEHLSLYARHSWPTHVRNSASADNIERLTTLLNEFLGSPLDSSPAYQCWHRMATKDPWLDGKNDSIFKPALLSSLSFRPSTISGFAFCAFALDECLPNWHSFDWVKSDKQNTERNTFLELAVLSGSVRTCRHLIENGMDVNARSTSQTGSALALACATRNIEVIEFLVKEGGAQVNLKLEHGEFGSALAAATLSGKVDVVKYLVQKGKADVNMQLEHGLYGSALAAAATNGYLAVVKYLVEKCHADVNMQLKHGSYGSALATAAYGGHTPVVEYLVKRGADINMQLQHKDYGSALAAAAAGSSLEVVKYLAEKGAEVNLQLQYGECGSALAAAALIPWEPNVIQFLVRDAGAQVNMQLRHGKYGSALAAAVAVKETLSSKYADDDAEETLKFLITEAGADVNLQLDNGDYANALDAAQKAGWPWMVRLLMEYSLEEKDQGYKSELST